MAGAQSYHQQTAQTSGTHPASQGSMQMTRVRRRELKEQV